MMVYPEINFNNQVCLPQAELSPLKRDCFNFFTGKQDEALTGSGLNPCSL